MDSSRPAIGNASPKETFDAIAQDPDAKLIDVRTRAEWAYVGLPELPGTAEPVLLEWQTFPAMTVNESFVQALETACTNKAAALYFLCRSGVRSLAAAQAMQARGYSRCFNIVDGFEGPPDEEGHRGNRAGWKADGLPWRQS